MEQNPHIKVDFQWFAFTDLGKKISVGYATGTAPDGFVSQDWFMPTWLDKGLLAPLDVKQLRTRSRGRRSGNISSTAASSR
jgi:multiple sugar transport system substrate-binding protein